MSQSIGDIPFNQEQIQLILNGGHLKCEDFHDDTCLVSALKAFVSNVSQEYKYFIPIFLVPFLLFQRKKLRKDPIRTIGKTLINYARSVCFLSGYIASTKYFLCKIQNQRQAVDPWGPSLTSAISSIFLLVENKSRRAEVTLFIMVRFIELAFRLLNKRGIIPEINNWELLIFGLAMGTINYHYHHNVLIFYIISLNKLNLPSWEYFRLFGVEYQNINIKYKKMSGGTTIMIGSIIYALLGVVGCIGFSVYVTKKTKNPQDVPENRSITIVSVTIATVCLWLMWVVAYMAQLNPLIEPEYQEAE